MKVLVACEFSGRVRDAFAQRGHTAVSCDVRATEITTTGSAMHIRGDVRRVLDQGWDLMIAHPPCTHLATSGARWFSDKQKYGQQQAALAFVRTLLDAPIDKIALENPVSVISSQIRKPDQIIHPWQFGHDAAKTTCLWLKNLPPLVPTQIVTKDRYENQTPSGQNRLSPGLARKMDRSRTYTGIAEAMAQQWG